MQLANSPASQSQITQHRMKSDNKEKKAKKEKKHSSSSKRKKHHKERSSKHSSKKHHKRRHDSGSGSSSSSGSDSDSSGGGRARGSALSQLERERAAVQASRYLLATQPAIRKSFREVCVGTQLKGVHGQSNSMHAAP